MSGDDIVIGTGMALASSPSGESGKIRLDKWLWFARFFKTRSVAAKVCGDGGVRISGTLVTKSHATVRPGDVVTFAQGRHIRVVKVLALGERRGPAPEAQALYEDLAPPVKEEAIPDPYRPEGWRPAGSGRPTKRERRELDRLHGDE